MSPLSAVVDVDRNVICWWLSWWRICLQYQRPKFNPWVRKIPWRGKWQPTPVLLPGLVGYSPWCHKESDMTEWLTCVRAHTHTHGHTHTHTHTHTVSEIAPRHLYGFGSWGSTLKALMKFSFGDFGTILQYLWDFYLGQSINIHKQVRNHQKTEIQAFGTSGLLPPTPYPSNSVVAPDPLGCLQPQ